jgi:hypothetical protein
MLQAAKRAGAAAIASGRRAGGSVPDRHTDDPDPGAAPDPKYRRLLDGYAEPGRLRRLKQRQQRRQAARRGRLRRWLTRLLRRKSR